jgi:dextranase
MFDPANPQWQNYLDTQEANVFAAYPFDGWQVDQVGSPAGNDYDSTGQMVTVWKTFAPFLRAAQTRLHKPLIFNNVGGYGLYDTAAHTQDAAMFIECWPALGQTTYHDLQTIIDQASEWSGGKAVVLAAYMDAKYGEKFAGHAPGQFNLPGVLLTDAAIFASGGDHLELGEDAQMLNNEYYPNHNLVPSPALLTALQRYYDFLVGYENVLRSGDGLTPSQNAPSLSVPSSPDAKQNTVWTFAKTGPHGQTLQFINLMGENSSDWRDDLADHPAPTVQSNLIVTYYAPAGTVKSAAWASPDSPEITLHPLKFMSGTDTHGAFIRFTLPRLAYWDMVYLTTR